MNIYVNIFIGNYKIKGQIRILKENIFDKKIIKIIEILMIENKCF